MSQQLVAYLVAEGLVRSAGVQSAMLRVDRRAFINPAVVGPDAVYKDTPQYNGEGQTISAPHMHAMCLEQLAGHLVSGARVLDVGSGSGYLTACMAHMVGPHGYVLGIEKVRELASRSVRSIVAACPDLATEQIAGTGTQGAPSAALATVATAATAATTATTTAAAAPTTARNGSSAATTAAAAAAAGVELMGAGLNWAVLHGNVLSRFLEAQQPFQAIHVGAAADSLPQELVQALNPGGRMVIPVGPQGATQVLVVVDKDLNGAVTTSEICAVNYVPLTRPTYV